MGTALVQGLLQSEWVTPDQVSIAELYEPRRGELRALLPGVHVDTSPTSAEGTILATKPDAVEAAAAAAVAAGTGRILSIAAGVTLETIQAATGEGVPVVRAMPNTPALVREGASAISGGTFARDSDMDWAHEILASVGQVVRVPESELDAVTGLSGSGPAYVFLVAEALIDAGVQAGLSVDVSTTLALQTVRGAAALLAGGESPADLRAMVTSPGGTTAEGISVLESAGVRSAFADAVKAAASRSRELGGG
jgi:pyrroline-5-carboxylate reductase